MGYLKSFSLTLKELSDLKTNEISFVSNLIKISLKYLLNFFPPYRKKLNYSFTLLIDSLPKINYTVHIVRTMVKDFLNLTQEKCDLQKTYNYNIYYSFFQSLMYSNIQERRKNLICEEFISVLIDLIDRKEMINVQFNDSNQLEIDSPK